ncbi:serine/threonine protein kinase [Thalassospira xiamenensis]|uniref:serine/threonine protein kinase n=1 Tax=Thalassospira xiamenensis TaxID=220697 RepID=UPI0015F0B45F|nr:protein kinase [Thalassospira xiamenensis]
MDKELVCKIASELCSENGWGEPRYIDSGNSASVFEVEHPADGATALKIYDPSFFRGENALIEINRVKLQVKLVEHGQENIIKILNAGEILSHSTWYLLMEFSPWKSLDKMIEGVPDEEVHNLIKQLVEAVIFLDKNKLIHRDIKPANILVSDDYKKIKLLDLGVIRSTDCDAGNGTDYQNDRKFIATPQYSPPEYITREELKGNDGFKAINLYQIGAVLHDLIMKKEIFSEEAGTGNKYRVYQAVTHKNPVILNRNVPFVLRRLCAESLEKDPVKRIKNLQFTDFLEDCDEPEIIRRLVGGIIQSSGSDAQSVSLSSWSKKVRYWISSAVRMHSDVLVRAIYQKEKIDNGIRWKVRFGNHSLSVLVDIIKINGVVEIVVRSESDEIVFVPICKIGPDGLEIEEVELVGALADQFIYVLSLCEDLEKYPFNSDQ